MVSTLTNFFDLQDDSRIQWFFTVFGKLCSLCNIEITNKLMKRYQIYDHNKNRYARFHEKCFNKLQQGELL